MAGKLDPDELNDRDDDLPVLADEDGDDEADAPEASILDELDDHEEHVKGLLSDEELAALEGEEGEEEAGDDGEDNDADDGQGDSGDAGDEAAHEAATDEPAPVAQQPVQAAPNFELSAEEKAQIEEEADEAEAKALEDWRDGELTDDELKARMRDIRAETDHKRHAAIDAKRQEQEEAEWQNVVKAFHTDARSYIEQHPGLEAAGTIEVFDRHVRAVTGNARFDGMSNVEKLAAAHRLLLAEAEILGIDVPKPKSAKKPAAADPAPAAKPKPKPKPEVVPTLARVPAAAANSASDGKWGNLQAIMERGTPEQIERAMASLTEEEREAFASMDV